ncbi:MAG: DNA repair protein RadC [Chitinispirillaceae bacterium]|nr:DNA repair protein RadC [Chitinispirillaceae bacterium]
MNTLQKKSAPGDENRTLSEGHRARLRERFAGNGINALHAHEIVELLLSYVIPRRDTKAAAKELIRRYTCLNALLNAPAEELSKVNGVGKRSAEFLSFIREVNGFCLKEKYQRKSMLSHRRDAEEYLRFHFGMRRDEYVAAIFLGNRNQVIATEVIAEGTVNQCAVYPRVIIERALRCHATSIIIAHNHPGGGLKPSEADWVLTGRLCALCRLLDIPLLDHLVVSHDEVVSLKEMPRWPGSSGSSSD